MYIEVPHQLFTNKNTNAMDVVTYVALRIIANNNNECSPSHKQIAIISRLGFSTVKKSVRKLLDNGFLEIEKHRDESGRNFPHTYSFKDL